MEEQKECNTIGNNVHSFYFVKFRPSLKVVEKHEADKQYQLMNLARLRINEEIAQQKGEEHQINQKLMWFPDLDKRIKWITWEIDNLKRYDLGNVEPNLPINSVPRTTGFLHLPEKDDQTPIRPDRRRCQKRLVKKGKMDNEYLQQVEEQLLSSKKSNGMTPCGMQELNDMIESVAQRVQHGNKNRAGEMQVYHMIDNLGKQKKSTVLYQNPTLTLIGIGIQENEIQRDTDWKRSTQHRINIRLDDIEKLKRYQTGRKARVTRLKADLELVRKNISSLEKELESVNSKRIEAYKRAHEIGEQSKEMKSCYAEYQSLMTYVKELAQKGDVAGD